MQDPIHFFNVEYLFQVVYSLITGDANLESFNIYWELYSVIAYMAAAVFLIGSIYAYIRLRQILRNDNEVLKILTEEALSNKDEPQNNRWAEVIEHINSVNESDWKLAIIEADSILDDMMTRMGYIQPSLGEKLKSVEKSDFLSIDKAWEAHKVRNQIAHAGSDFVFSHQEANRIVNLYKDIFTEFDFI